MSVIENYLHEVEEYLTSDTDSDVLQELESSIYDAVEEQESEQGRELTNEETAAILLKFGAPIDVAAKYAPQQYLIGPELFPSFRYGLQVMFGFVVVLQCLNILLRAVGSESGHFSIAHLLWVIFTSSVWGFASLVVIFGLVEKNGVKGPGIIPSWDPLKSSARKQTKGDREDAVTNVISDTVMLILWNLWVGPSAIGGKNISQFTISFPDMYLTLFWPVNALIVVSLLLYGWQLFSNNWNKLRINVAVALDVVSLIVIALLLTSADQVVISNQDIGHLERIASHATTIFKVSLAVIFAFVAWDLRNHFKVWKKVNG